MINRQEFDLRGKASAVSTGLGRRMRTRERMVLGSTFVKSCEKKLARIRSSHHQLSQLSRMRTAQKHRGALCIQTSQPPAGAHRLKTLLHLLCSRGMATHTPSAPPQLGRLPISGMRHAKLQTITTARTKTLFSQAMARQAQSIKW
eukprot:21445_2